MITKINPALAHAYKWGRHRLLISMEITTWQTRRVSGEKFAGESCVFFSEDSGQSWAELYLLNMTGDRCGKFAALVLNLRHAAPYIVDGAGGELKYMERPYRLITDEPVDFRNVTRLTGVDRVRIGSIQHLYRQV